MNEKLWDLIRDYGYWSYHAGLMNGKDDRQQYEIFTKKQDDAFFKIKQHLLEPTGQQEV